MVEQKLSPHFEDFDLDLRYAPASYEPYNSSQTGEYTTLYFNKLPVGVLWTNGDDAAGFWPADEALCREASTVRSGLLTHFNTSAEMELQAPDAYQVAKSELGFESRDVRSGSLAGVPKLAFSLRDPIIAAAPAAPANSPAEQTQRVAPLSKLVDYFVTLDDSEKVLELVRTDASGMYVRSSGGWFKVDPDNDLPTIWDREIKDVTPAAVNIFDTGVENGTGLESSDFDSVAAPA